MEKHKKTYAAPKLRRLEPTDELFELFADELAARGLRAAVRPKRAGAGSR